MPGQVSVETSPNATPFGFSWPELITEAAPNDSLLPHIRFHGIDESYLDNPDLGPFLARCTVTSRHNPDAALDYATKSIDRGSGLELAMSFRVLAALYTSLERFEEAVSVLERSIEVPVLGNGSGHALAIIFGCMHLELDQSIKCYDSGLMIQIEALEDSDPRVAETSRYLSEALVQVMQLGEAQNLCKKALEIHKEQSAAASLEDTADHHRLLALVCEGKADYESALEHLVPASMSMIANRQENELATIHASIGSIYLSLCIFDVAIFAYQKALAVLKSTKGKNKPSVASVFIRLTDLYYKTCKVRESKFYSENALRIYSKPVSGTTSEEIASGLTEVLGIYEGLNEPEEVLKLLENTMKLLEDTDGHRSTIAGIEALMSVMFYLDGRNGEDHSSFESAVEKLHANGENKSAFFGIVLNQMRIANVLLYRIDKAIEIFKNARKILEQECGSYHLETLGVYSNLAVTYDAMGRVEDAIEILEYILKTGFWNRNP
ncbi:hypothetical protein GQ457_04G030540 [Hibiscus cannabinus]